MKYAAKKHKECPKADSNYGKSMVYLLLILPRQCYFFYKIFRCQAEEHPKAARFSRSLNATRSDGDFSIARNLDHVLQEVQEKDEKQEVRTQRLRRRGRGRGPSSQVKSKEVVTAGG